MITRLFNQPFGMNGQIQQLGELINRELDSGNYVHAEIWVAYATAGGTSRLYGALEAFIRSGHHADVHVGLNNGVTSGQAVEHMLKAGATVYGFDTGGTNLFHPKIYLLRGPASTLVSVGSSNLTSEGLFRNFEANTITSFDPNEGADVNALNELTAVLRNLRALTTNCRVITTARLPGLFASGLLLDERATPRPQRVPAGPQPGRRVGAGRLVIPAAPPPHPDVAPVRAPGVQRQRGAAAGQAAQAAVGSGPQYFAMTLSEFDTSHRRGVLGTPEISLPENTAAFFPPVSLQGRNYPDQYFQVLLNERNGTAKLVQYRIWHRPPGSAVGHVDWRINVGHDTIDQTRNAAGDILLITRLPMGSSPEYEAWIVHPADPEHATLLAKCSSNVQTRGAGGVKQYGVY